MGINSLENRLCAGRLACFIGFGECFGFGNNFGQFDQAVADAVLGGRDRAVQGVGDFLKFQLSVKTESEGIGFRFGQFLQRLLSLMELLELA